MKTLVEKMKPVIALAGSALLGAALVIGAVAMLGNAAHPSSSATTERAISGIGRFNTTDIHVVPVERDAR